MVDTAAHLVDRVLPAIPIRQWVLSFPYPLRLLYSTHPQAMTRTLGIVLRAIETHLIRKAGLTRASGAGSGAITFIQRFGSALNLNVHLHMLIPDGVYTLSHGKPRFHAVSAPSHSELTALLNRIVRRVTRQLTRDGQLDSTIGLRLKRWNSFYRRLPEAHSGLIVVYRTSYHRTADISRHRKPNLLDA